MIHPRTTAAPSSAPTNPSKRSWGSWTAFFFRRTLKNVLINRFFWALLAMRASMMVGMDVAMRMPPTRMDLVELFGWTLLTTALIAAIQTLKIDVPIQKNVDSAIGTLTPTTDPAAYPVAKNKERGLNYNLDVLNRAMDLKRAYHGNRWMVIGHIIVMAGIGYGLAIALQHGMHWPIIIMSLTSWGLAVAWGAYEGLKVLSVAHRALPLASYCILDDPNPQHGSAIKLGTKPEGTLVSIGDTPYTVLENGCLQRTDGAVLGVDQTFSGCWPSFKRLLGIDRRPDSLGQSRRRSHALKTPAAALLRPAASPLRTTGGQQPKKPLDKQGRQALYARMRTAAEARKAAANRRTPRR